MREDNLKWIVCQIGARQSYTIARMADRADRLEEMITDVWIPHGSRMGSLFPRLVQRNHSELEACQVRAPTARAIFNEAVYKLRGLHGMDRNITRNSWFQDFAAKRLRKLAAHGDGQRRIVFSYSYASKEIFRVAKQLGWVTVLGQMNAGPREDKIIGDLYRSSSAQKDSFTPYPESYWDEWREEVALADAILVNSDWSKQCLIDDGVNPNDIHILPHAYEPPTDARFLKRSAPYAYTPERPLHALFLGQVCLRKGAVPLLDAVRLLKDRPIKFFFVGPVSVNIPDDLANAPNIEWVGSVPRDRVHQFYKNSDIFLFPTFSDGFGRTQLEALGWGVPVIASRHCAQLVDHGTNGFVLPDITATTIGAALNECVSNPKMMEEMKAAAANTYISTIDALFLSLIHI